MVGKTPIDLHLEVQIQQQQYQQPKGAFDLKSAYLLAIEPLHDSPFQGKWIWKLDTLHRIQTFIWKCMHQIIGVKDCLAARGMLIDTSCPLCQCRSESIMHALRDCRIVRTTWHQLGIYHTNTSFFSANLQDWLTSNCKAAGYHAPGQPPSIAVDIIN